MVITEPARLEMPPFGRKLFKLIVSGMGYEQQHTAGSTTCNTWVCFKHKGVTEYLEIMSSNEKTKRKKLQVLSRNEAAMNTPVQSIHSSSSNKEPF